MRSFIAGVSLTVLLLGVGCNLMPHRRDTPGGGVAIDPSRAPTVEQLVNYLNVGADRIDKTQVVACDNMTIDVDSPQGKVGLTGNLRCQTPRNFRMKGVVFGKPEVDIGSNDKEFWYWIARDQPPYLYHCSYDALSRGTRIPFPFQPDMVVNALGLAHYNPAGNYQIKIVALERGRQAIELIEPAMSPQNQPIKKVTVFDAAEAAQPGQPQVIAYILRDAQDKPICVASVRRVQPIGTSGAVIPKEMLFNWPEQKLKLTLRLENPQLITMTPEKAALVFTRQNLTSMQSVDLATQTFDGVGLQRAGASEPIYRR
jgi:hypothetical protein